MTSFKPFLGGIVSLVLIPSFESGKHFHRVIAGNDDIDNKYSYVVTLTHVPFEYRFCTGSLISNLWVLSAAHCFNQVLINFRVRYGDLTAKPRNGTYRKVLAVYIAPNFRKVREFPISRRRIVEMPLTNDVALLKIEQLDLVRLGKISAVDFKSLVGRPVRYVGTGITVRDSIIKIDKFQTLLTASKDERRPRQIGEAVIVSCPKDDPDELKTNAALLCLRPKCCNRYQRAQKGDSGGPLLFLGKIVGVACTVKHVDIHHEAMYTAISPYLDWIQRLTAAESLSLHSNGTL